MRLKANPIVKQLAGTLENGTVWTQACGTMLGQMEVQHVFRIEDGFTVQFGADRTFVKQNVSVI